MNFSKIIKEQRQKKKMTQEELASRLGITPQAVSKWETGVGLPDVALFPLLADILGISIEALFGIDCHPQEKQTFSEYYEGMPLVGYYQERGCYSDKKPVRKDETRIFFEDGSTADLRDGIAENCGEGEIRFLFRDYREESFGYSTSRTAELTEKIGRCDSLCLSLSYICTVSVRTVGQSETARVYAKGSELFVSKIKVEEKDGVLSVWVGDSHRESPHTHDNRLDILLPFQTGKKLNVSINGASDVLVTPFFESGEVKINGSGDLTLSDFEQLTVQINGSGDVTVNQITKAVQLSVSGSGDIQIQKGANPTIRIAGSGDININEVSGNLSAQIFGSGDLSCTGEVDVLTVKIKGSGDFGGKELTVGEATIDVEGSGEIELGRIVRKSVEKLGKNAELKVGRRG